MVGSYNALLPPQHLWNKRTNLCCNSLHRCWWQHTLVHQINGSRSHSQACNGECALKLNVDKYNVSSKSNPNRLRGKLTLLPLVNTQNHLTSRFADYNLVLAYMTPRESVQGKTTQASQSQSISVSVRCRTVFIKYKYNLPTQ